MKLSACPAAAGIALAAVCGVPSTLPVGSEPAVLGPAATSVQAATDFQGTSIATGRDDAEHAVEGVLGADPSIEPRAPAVWAWHHGSNSSPTDGFLRAAQPALVTISRGNQRSGFGVCRVSFDAAKRERQRAIRCPTGRSNPPRRGVLREEQDQATVTQVQGAHGIPAQRAREAFVVNGSRGLRIISPPTDRTTITTEGGDKIAPRDRPGPVKYAVRVILQTS